MNALTEQIIRSILTTRDVWDKKTHELNYSKVINAYRDIREARFYDQVSLPLYFRAGASARAVAPIDERERHFEHNEDPEGYYLIECDRPDCTMQQVSYALSEIIDARLQVIWESEEWEYELTSKR